MDVFKTEIATPSCASSNNHAPGWCTIDISKSVCQTLAADTKRKWDKRMSWIDDIEAPGGEGYCKKKEAYYYHEPTQVNCHLSEPKPNPDPNRTLKLKLKLTLILILTLN